MLVYICGAAAQRMVQERQAVLSTRASQEADGHGGILAQAAAGLPFQSPCQGLLAAVHAHRQTRCRGRSKRCGIVVCAAGRAGARAAPLQRREAHAGVHAAAGADGGHARARAQVRDDEVQVACVAPQQPLRLRAPRTMKLAKNMRR